MHTIPLEGVLRLDQVGGKAWTLAQLRHEGIPVPAGFCVPPGLPETLSTELVIDELEASLKKLTTPTVSVRSSAITEDGRHASFAGIYSTELNVPANGDEVLASLTRISASAHSGSATTYRQSIGISSDTEMAGLVQEMIYADSAGVMFTANPVTGENQFIIESAWGLGESVVSGKVVPDRYIISQYGKLISYNPGNKDKKLITADSGVIEVPVFPPMTAEPSISDGMIQKLVAVGTACADYFDSPQDIEWATEKGALWITQCRPISTL